MSLAGKVALIIGGAKNLGAEIASQLAPLGCDLALHYNSAKTKEEASKTEARLKKEKPDVKIAFYAADLTGAGAVDNLFAKVKKDFGRIDIVINTAGMVLKKAITDISEEDYDKMFAINSKVAFFVIKAGAAYVSEGGKIVSIVTALLAAFTGLYTVYAGAKAPVEHFTRGAAKELADKHISVNAIAPGPMNTPFFYPQESPESVAFLKSVAMGGRLTEITDIAPLVKFLCTDGGWITGQTLFANGGFTTR